MVKGQFAYSHELWKNATRGKRAWGRIVLIVGVLSLPITVGRAPFPICIDLGLPYEVLVIVYEGQQNCRINSLWGLLPGGSTRVPFFQQKRRNPYRLWRGGASVRYHQRILCRQGERWRASSRN